MLVRRLTVENVRSFLDRREVLLDGPISILIGPNGGGKTNLLDVLVIMLRRYVFNAPYYRHSPTAEEPNRWVEEYNDQLNSLNFEKHSNGGSRAQFVELELEITQSDIDNMRDIQTDAATIRGTSKRRFANDPWIGVEAWDIGAISSGARLTVTWVNGSVAPTVDPVVQNFLHYLHIFETDNMMRAEVGKAALRLPMVYLPVNRTSNGFGSNVGLSSYNDFELKRTTDASSSRTNSNIIQLAVGRLAQKYRLLQESSNVEAREVFYRDPNLVDLSVDLKELGYSWELVTINPLNNSYDIRLTKHGSSFLVDAASSGERELLTYLFAIYALNVRDALIVVDEPELHLHPRWQMQLFALFEKLSKTTGNQFVLATHSPTFISPASIQYVSRVYAEDQKSNIVRLNSGSLPNAKHLFNVVNSQNNERMFFTDKVLLVEGLSDRIVFEKVLEIVSNQHKIEGALSLEVISVGGKGLFPAYRKLLAACRVHSVVIADLDYVEQVGSERVKTLFMTNASEIKTDVFDNVKSLDGAAFVSRIDEALSSGNLDDAKEIWDYIRSRRISLRADLDQTQQELLGEFISSQEEKGTFILSRGALEDYLPSGYKGKDIDKLIGLVSSPTFWDDLPVGPRSDFERIARTILCIPHDAEQELGQ